MQSGPPTQVSGGPDGKRQRLGRDHGRWREGADAAGRGRGLPHGQSVGADGQSFADRGQRRDQFELYYTPNNIPGVWGASPFIYGPHWFNADLSVNKTIPIRESVRMTLQGQLLNVFNHPAFGLGGLGAHSLSYGQSTSLITTARRVEIRANVEF